MTFTSLFFVPFAALFFVFWPRVRASPRACWLYLTAFSLAFYATYGVHYVPLLLATGLVDFGAGLAMTRWPHRAKAFLIASLASNLGVLAVFKYAPLDLELPAGISFYTFQSMSYAIDVYRRRIAATSEVLHFFAYLSIWPHLVAGPIQRATHLMPQLAEAPRALDEARRFEGLRLVVHGYFKKLVIADNLAPAVNAAFAQAPESGGAAFWFVAVTMFAFQIYGDFAGYSDIARGMGLWMGYDLGPNFDRPYAAGSVREFWTRWHISLSTWFRDYVFASMPLSGGIHRSVWITMLLSGVWHGAGWKYVLWGAMHALFISVEQVTRWPKRVGRAAAWLLTLGQVWAAWLVFRAPSVSAALAIALASADPRALWRWPVATPTAAWFALALGVIGVAPLPRVARAEPFVLAVAIAAAIFLRGPGSDFIYIQF
jgi:alginate O-acetyltransferase complex protein AlgI